MGNTVKSMLNDTMISHSIAPVTNDAPPCSVPTKNKVLV